MEGESRDQSSDQSVFARNLHTLPVDESFSSNLLMIAKGNDSEITRKVDDIPLRYSEPRVAF